jgi:N-methylhydantoinase A
VSEVIVSASGVRVGFDIGGTFTDLILVDADGRAFIKKIPSAPGNYALAAVEGLRQLLETANLDASSVSELVHGTTVATNAILERKGARTGLITTLGYRDVLEIGRLRMPGLYNLNYQRPAPLVPRDLRIEVEERLNWKGDKLTPIDVASVERAVDKLRNDGVQSIAFCLLHSYANPSHEIVIGRIVRERAARRLSLIVERGRS